MTEFELFNNIMLIKNDSHHSVWIKEAKKLDHNDYHLHKTKKALDKFFPRRNINSSLMIDVGAHWGTHTIFFAKQNSRVVAFEPVKDNFKCLVHNLSKFSNVILINNPVSDSNETVEMINPSKTQNGTYQCEKSETGLECKTIDSYRFQNLIYLKVDVEGYEYKVLMGARETIDRCKPIIDIETSIHRSNYNDIMIWIRDNNYSVYDSVGDEVQKDLILVNNSRIFSS